jgi:hypothetical protein
MGATRKRYNMCELAFKGCCDTEKGTDTAEMLLYVLYPRWVTQW